MRLGFLHLLHEQLFVSENVAVPLGDRSLVTDPDLLGHLNTHSQLFALFS